MKLIYCLECGDLFKMGLHVITRCNCGLARGIYLSRFKAVHNGKGIPIILNSYDLADAVRRVRSRKKEKNTIGFQIRCGTSYPFHLNISVLDNKRMEAAALEEEQSRASGLNASRVSELARFPDES